MNWFKKMSQQKLLIITRGPSGSGKSTMVEQLSSETGAPVFSSDEYFMQSGKYAFDPSKLGIAHEWNLNRAREAMQEQVPIIIIDNTNSKFWEMRNYVTSAQEFGYQVEFKEPDWDSGLKDENGRWNVDFLDRMQDSSSRNKRVPRQVLERMVGGYEYDPSVEKILSSERPVFK